jgi:hypothetical protein
VITASELANSCAGPSAHCAKLKFAGGSSGGRVSIFCGRAYCVGEKPEVENVCCGHDWDHGTADLETSPIFLKKSHNPGRRVKAENTPAGEHHSVNMLARGEWI